MSVSKSSYYAGISGTYVWLYRNGHFYSCASGRYKGLHFGDYLKGVGKAKPKEKDKTGAAEAPEEKPEAVKAEDPAPKPADVPAQSESPAKAAEAPAEAQPDAEPAKEGKEEAGGTT